MIRSGNSIRFTSKEVEMHRELGIDLNGVKSANDYASAIQPWLSALAEVRPDLLEKMAMELASAKGLKLPPPFAIVPLDDSRERS